LSIFLSAASACPAHSAVAPPSRPLVIIFASGQETGSGASAAADDATAAAEGTMKGARAVRDRLEDSNAVSATVYQSESPVFQRAALDAKINIEKRDEVSDADQIGLGKAAGAIYVVVVSTHKTTDGSGDFEMELRGRDIATRKVWKDQARFKPGSVFTPVAPSDANAVQNGGVKPLVATGNALDSAANTLVTRLLNGPLGDYGRTAPPPDQVLQPPPPAPPTPLVASPAPTPAAETDMVKATAQRAQTLLNDGDTDAAITLLRRTVNQVPLNGRLRLLLAKAYLTANRNTDAASEATRAMTLTPPENRADRVELTHILAEAMGKNGDTVAARATYEQVIAAQPQHADWARLALAGLLESQGQVDEAEAQYRAVLQADKTNQEAMAGLVHVYTARGNYTAALEQVGASDRVARHSAAIQIFDQASAEIAARMKENRAAWEAKKISREAFYKATTAQSQRATALVTLLRSAPPADNSPDTAKKGQARRVLSASLLAQASTALLNFLETGSADSGSQADLWLVEFQKELTEAQALAPSVQATEAAK
jgi:tetratricopeptide (TPR) repeat protein